MSMNAFSRWMPEMATIEPLAEIAGHHERKVWAKIMYKLKSSSGACRIALDYC
jgi:hypothetical protein